MIYRNGNVVGGWPCAIPFAHVADICCMGRSFAVPFGRVTERINAEGVKPLPYGRWFTGMVILLLNNRLPFRLVMWRKLIVGNGLVPFRLTM